jgi:hypothetical protein
VSHSACGEPRPVGADPAGVSARLCRTCRSALYRIPPGGMVGHVVSEVVFQAGAQGMDLTCVEQKHGKSCR